jgi:hypothetical protein
MSLTGRYTQNPCSGHFECNGDFSTVEGTLLRALMLGLQLSSHRYFATRGPDLPLPLFVSGLRDFCGVIPRKYQDRRRCLADKIAVEFNVRTHRSGRDFEDRLFNGAYVFWSLGSLTGNGSRTEIANVVSLDLPFFSWSTLRRSLSHRALYVPGGTMQPVTVEVPVPAAKPCANLTPGPRTHEMR